MYIVHMRRVTASQARKNWFNLLDDVVAGEVVVVERKGVRVVLRREDALDAEAEGALPDFRSLIEAPSVDEADQWNWEWRGPGDDLGFSGKTGSQGSGKP